MPSFLGDRAGLMGALAATAAVLLVGAGGTAAYLYATDHTLVADVTGTECAGLPFPESQNTVAIKTRLLGLEHEVRGLPDRECLLLQEGDFVEHRIRSKHTTLYRSTGACVYDTQTGTACAGAGV